MFTPLSTGWPSTILQVSKVIFVSIVYFSHLCFLAFLLWSLFHSFVTLLPALLLQKAEPDGSYVIDSHVLEARRRGVLFDIGHGAGAFNWTVAEKCAALGFWPDTISTDLHQVRGRQNLPDQSSLSSGRPRNSHLPVFPSRLRSACLAQHTTWPLL